MTFKLNHVIETTSPIAPNGPSVTATTAVPGENARFTFTGTAGRQISLRLTGVTYSTCDVRVLKPDGTVLAGVTSIGPGGGFMDAQTLPNGGTYTILVDPPGTGTGCMTLTLYEFLHITDTITPGGAAVTVNLATPGQNAAISINGSAGQQVSVFVNSTTVTNCVLSVKKPDGTTVSSINLWSGVRFIDRLTIKTTESYTVFVNPTDFHIGSVTLTAYDVPADITGTISTDGTPATVTTTVAGQNASLTFSGTAGQKISLHITSATMSNTSVTVQKPDGTTLMSHSSVSTSGTFFDVQTLSAGGTYTIFVNPSGNNTGSMTLRLYDVPAVGGALTPGAPAVTAALNIPGQNAEYTFSGSAGLKVSLLVSGTPLTDCTVSIRRPDGTTQASINLWSGARFIDAQTVANAGTYTVLVDPRDANTGSVTFRLYDISTDATGALTAGGSSVPVSISTPGQNGRWIFEGTSGQQVTVRVTNNTMGTVTVSLLRPDNTTLTSSMSSGATITLSTQSLSVTGTYTVLINPSSSNTGTLTLQVTTP